jgi:hypothetical protein
VRARHLAIVDLGHEYSHQVLALQGFTDKEGTNSSNAESISIHNCLSSLQNLRDLSLLGMTQRESAIEILNSIRLLQITNLWFGYILNVESREDCTQVLQPLRDMPCLVKMFLNFIDEKWDPTSDTDEFYDMVLDCFTECGRHAWMFRTHI